MPIRVGAAARPAVGGNSSSQWSGASGGGTRRPWVSQVVADGSECRATDGTAGEPGVAARVAPESATDPVGPAGRESRRGSDPWPETTLERITREDRREASNHVFPQSTPSPSALAEGERASWDPSLPPFAHVIAWEDRRGKDVDTLCDDLSSCDPGPERERCFARIAQFALCSAEAVLSTDPEAAGLIDDLVQVMLVCADRMTGGANVPYLKAIQSIIDRSHGH